MNANAFRSVALCLLALVLAGCDGYRIGPLPGESFTTYYHPDDGRQVKLLLVHSHIALEVEGISVPDGLSKGEEATLAAIAAEEPELESISLSGGESFGGNLATFHGIPIRGLSDDELLALIARLNATPEISSAEPIVEQDSYPNPILCRYCDGSYRVLPEFVAVFSASTPETEIDALIDNYGLEAEMQNRFQGQVTYRLRTTSETGYSTLEMANLLHAHPLTIRAYPAFGAGSLPEVT